MLDKLIQSKNKPHAIIFSTTVLSNIKEAINNYIKSIIFEGLDKEQQQKYSQKIDEDKFFDLITIDGFKETIKKEQILNLQNSFSLPGVDSINKKFYVIYGIENITKQSANSLLKFIEEPPHNTYGIFVTKSPQKIIGTIKSRCQIFHLDSQRDKLHLIFKKYKISNPNLVKIAESYGSIDQLEEDLKSLEFNLVYEFVDKILNKTNPTLLKALLEEFKTYSYTQIGKIIDALIVSLPDKQPKFYQLKDTIKFNPNKTLLFNKIIAITI